MRTHGACGAGGTHQLQLDEAQPARHVGVAAGDKSSLPRPARQRDTPATPRHIPPPRPVAPRRAARRHVTRQDACVTPRGGLAVGQALRWSAGPVAAGWPPGYPPRCVDACASRRCNDSESAAVVVCTQCVDACVSRRYAKRLGHAYGSLTPYPHEAMAAGKDSGALRGIRRWRREKPTECGQEIAGATRNPLLLNS